MYYIQQIMLAPWDHSRDKYNFHLSKTEFTPFYSTIYEDEE